MRRLLEALRAIPELVWGLVLVSVIGTGPEAGIIALALHGTGSLGRLYAESFENIRTEPVHAIAATGARPLAVAGFAYLPLAVAPLAVHTLFRLEWNVRAATIVGVIGAGGIGEALYNAQQLFFYRQMAAYIVITAADRRGGGLLERPLPAGHGIDGALRVKVVITQRVFPADHRSALAARRSNHRPAGSATRTR